MGHKPKVNLKGKAVLITGASSGLGRALAIALHKHGCKLHLCARNMEALNKIKQSLGTNVKTYYLDLSKLDSIDKFSNKFFMDDTAGIDILVNNAGLRFRGDVLNTTYKVYQQIFDVNFFGQVALTNAFLPHFLERNSGHVVAIGSIQGKLATPFRAPYSSSKHACQAYYDAVRAEMSSACSNINVTVVNPGYIKTMASKNAILNDGSVAGKADENNERGMDVDVVADLIVQAIIKQHNEVNIAPIHHKIAMFIRLVSPDLYFWIIKKRSEVNKNK